jgi:hypothetical protein
MSTAPPRPTMFESTLQLLQQFNVRLKSVMLKPFKRHIGDMSTYCVCCKKCQREITQSGDINATLTSAPAAILKHLGLDFEEHAMMPLLNSNEGFFKRSFNRLRSDLARSPCKAVDKHSMFGFCEALKIDNNMQYRSDKERRDAAVNTLSFLNIMFENVVDEVDDDDAGSDASANSDKTPNNSILIDLIMNIEDPEFVHNENDNNSTRLNKGWNLFLSRLYVKNLVDVILISLKADKDPTSEEWRRTLLHSLFREADIDFSVEYMDGLWHRRVTEDQVKLLNHEKERPTLVSEYKEFNCEPIMGSTGLGWD